MASLIKVMVVDDSAFMRKVISEILSEEDDIEVIAKARNGVDALKKIKKEKPDVITLDVEMPKMNGIELLENLMEKHPLPVIMLSKLTSEESKIAVKALQLGAFDFLAKPSGSISLDIEIVKEELLTKVRLAAKASIQKKVKKQNVEDEIKPRDKVSKRRKKANMIKGSKGKQLVVIGASTGGPKALKEVITLLPKNFSAPILIVQHMPPGFTTSLADRLDKRSAITVKEAETGDRLKAGTALLAPGDYHMLLNSNKIELSQENKLHNVRPSVDKTLESVVKNYDGNIIGVLLTGMGSDGAKGLELVKEFGGQTIAQDKETSVVYGMPKAAVELGVVDQVLPINKIAKEIVTVIS